jgi:hypothetical protein
MEMSAVDNKVLDGTIVEHKVLDSEVELDTHSQTKK